MTLRLLHQLLIVIIVFLFSSGFFVEAANLTDPNYCWRLRQNNWQETCSELRHNSSPWSPSSFPPVTYVVLAGGKARHSVDTFV